MFWAGWLWPVLPGDVADSRGCSRLHACIRCASTGAAQHTCLKSAGPCMCMMHSVFAGPYGRHVRGTCVICGCLLLVGKPSGRTWLRLLSVHVAASGHGRVSHPGQQVNCCKPGIGASNNCGSLSVTNQLLTAQQTQQLTVQSQCQLEVWHVLASPYTVCQRGQSG